MPDSVLTRYSCREFTPDPVTGEQLRVIVRAGMQAPTAKNEQPWEFLVVQSEQGREALAASSPYAGSCRRAPVVIVALADLNRISPESPWWVQDMSACVENMLVEAVEQGLGGVWLGMYPRQDRVSAIREAFELPENLIPFAAVPVGHPAGEQKAKDRFDPKRIRWEK
ncbi:nitroreductase family protein [Enterocloster lavalensis]|uniref:nitroreductase family protein n=1 Tax=Enterocloster lavalensis TaxID=460384 RepID=UPI0026670794|nr:nitroreductase family protein [Enterocloster lavalensis]